MTNEVIPPITDRALTIEYAYSEEANGPTCIHHLEKMYVRVFR